MKSLYWHLRFWLWVHGFGRIDELNKREWDCSTAFALGYEAGASEALAMHQAIKETNDA